MSFAGTSEQGATSRGRSAKIISSIGISRVAKTPWPIVSIDFTKCDLMLPGGGYPGSLRIFYFVGPRTSHSLCPSGSWSAGSPTPREGIMVTKQRIVWMVYVLLVIFEYWYLSWDVARWQGCGTDCELSFCVLLEAKRTRVFHFSMRKFHRFDLGIWWEQ